MRKQTMMAAITVMAIAAAVIGCATKGSAVKIVEMENKGSVMGVATPSWIKIYTANGISRVQAQSEYRDKYCIIGEESGINRQFVLAWADSFSAQQRIGAMLRTNIESKYQAKVDATAQSTGGANSSTAAGTGASDYRQEINNSINSVVNVSYSGAQREADWWSLRRRYDPDQKDVFSDEYTAYVLYTIPKAELNRQVANALTTSVAADSVLYSITIALAQEILLSGFDYLGQGDLQAAATPAQTQQQIQAVTAGGPSGNIIIRNSSGDTGSIMSMVKIHKGYEIGSDPYIVYDKPVLGGQQANWDLPEGVYTIEVFLNDRQESIRPGLIGSGRTTIGITAGSTLTADFSGGNISSFTRR